jgi:phage-related protein
MNWTVETLNAAVDAEISDLPADMRARLVRVFQLIEAHGFQNLPSGTAKHLEDKLWELRISSASGISRAIYVTAMKIAAGVPPPPFSPIMARHRRWLPATGKRVVIVRVFVKKTQKTPQRELELARQRAKEVL